MVKQRKWYWFQKIIRNETGSPSLEIIALLPVLIGCCLFIWQISLIGIALIQAEVALQQGVQVLALTKDEEKTKQIIQEGSKSGSYRTHSVEITIHPQLAMISTTTEIDLVFFKTSRKLYVQSQLRTPMFE